MCRLLPLTVFLLFDVMILDAADAESSSVSVNTSSVIQALESDSLKLLEEGKHYRIYDAGVKNVASFQAIIQSSQTPIALGAEMRPYMDTKRLWTFVRERSLEIHQDSPAEIYVYNWVTRAQGQMIFDVGAIVPMTTVIDDLPNWLQLKVYPATKVASLIYVGPFPHQPHSGWDRIRWTERAAEKGLIYNEVMYREFYHRYEYSNNQHVTEIQISID